MAKQKIHSTTQDFTEIVEIADDILMFKNGTACLILEVSSVNFSLLTQDEQNAKIYSFMSLLNSLSFYIQILIVSKRVDVSAYLKLIDQKILSEKNPKIAQYLKLYKGFIQQLTTTEKLLDKKLYVVVPFSQLELGAIGSVKTAFKKSEAKILIQKAKGPIISKRDQVMSQLQKIGLSAKTLATEDLIKLCYEVFNDENLSLGFQENDVKNIVL